MPRPAPKPRKAEELPPIRVRHEPPTLEEALYAAEGLADDFSAQVEIAADLFGAPADEVRAHALELGWDRRRRPPPAETIETHAFDHLTIERGDRTRTVVVERKRPLVGVRLRAPLARV